MFNHRVAQTRNKAAVVLEAVLRLVQWASEHCRDQDLHVFVDHLGGRIDYRDPLMRAFPDRHLHVVEVSDQCSRYRLAAQRNDWHVEFVVEAEQRHLPVALASMLAKYVRELLMARFNAYWCGLAPQLRPTAGYYTDARRFLSDIDSLIARGGIPRERFVRRADRPFGSRNVPCPCRPAQPALLPRVLTLGGILLLTGAVRGQSPTEPAAHVWSAQVVDALAAYQAGDYAGAQRLCRQIPAQSAIPRVQQDAAVVEALCLLRLPVRTDRADGRTRLRELAAEDPTLSDDPECNLAYGIAQTALSETADALDALERAATGFAAQKLPARRAEALVALAEAWGRHGEWERTPPRFGVKRPLDAGQAEATRRRQIAALRERIAALPEQAEALAKLDLVLAQRMLDAGDQPAEGLAILTRLANAEPLNSTGATAALRLAERAESDGDWSAALRWYLRVQHEWHGDLADQAARRAFELARPQIVVETPASVPSAQPVHVRLRVRGVTAVQLEVRRVDVDAWLGSAPARQRGHAARVGLVARRAGFRDPGGERLVGLGPVWRAAGFRRTTRRLCAPREGHERRRPSAGFEAAGRGDRPGGGVFRRTARSPAVGHATGGCQDAGRGRRPNGEVLDEPFLRGDRRAVRRGQRPVYVAERSARDA